MTPVLPHKLPAVEGRKWKDRSQREQKLSIHQQHYQHPLVVEPSSNQNKHKGSQRCQQKLSWERTTAILSSAELSVVAGNKRHTGLLNSNLLSCSCDVAHGNDIISREKQLQLLWRKNGLISFQHTDSGPDAEKKTLILLLRKKSWCALQRNSKHVTLHLGQMCESEKMNNSGVYQILYRWETEHRKRTPSTTFQLQHEVILQRELLNCLLRKRVM